MPLHIDIRNANNVVVFVTLMLALEASPGFNESHMLQQAQERAIEQVAFDLTGELPLAGPERHGRLRSELLRVSGARAIQMDWGDLLPDPEVSLVFLERLAEYSPIMARLSLKLTVDELQGCWALPLKAEFDEMGRWRYPTVYDKENKKQGILAHRYVWRILIDPGIPRTEWLDHICRVHACCNPTHLEAVTPGINTKRGHDARYILGGQDPLFHPE